MSDAFRPSGLLQRCAGCWEPGGSALCPRVKHRGGSHGAEVNVLFQRQRERERGRRGSALSPSLSGLSAGLASWGCSWRLIEEQLCTLSSLIIGPVSRCSGPHGGGGCSADAGRGNISPLHQHLCPCCHPDSSLHRSAHPLSSITPRSPTDPPSLE